MNKEMIGVILAAGKGSRMYPFSETRPKSLLPILNRPLLVHQLEQMARLGIKKVIVVIGYYGFEIVRAIGDGHQLGLEIEYVDQDRTLGIAHALGCLEAKIDRPFLLFLGDIFFNVRDLDALVAPVRDGSAQAVLAAKREPDPEAIRRNFAIYQRPDGSVERVMEKPRLASTTLKGCGLYAFDLHVFDAVRRTPRTAARDEYEITDSIQILIRDGLRVEVMDGVEEDINLTFPEDLYRANLLELKRLGKERFVGKNFSGPRETEIRRAVIGDDVTVPAGAEIEDAVIFSGVKISDQTSLKRLIITPSQQVSLDSGPRR